MGQHCDPVHIAGVGDCTEGWDSLEKLLLGSGPSWHLRKTPAATASFVVAAASSTTHWASGLLLLLCLPHQIYPSSARLTHGGCGQCLSPHNLGWSQAIQKVTELAFSSKPCGKNKPAETQRAREVAGGGGCTGLSPGVWVSMSPLYSVTTLF